MSFKLAHLFTITLSQPEDITMKKAQATLKDDAPKKPLGQKLGRGTTKATMGAAFGLGRFAFSASKNFIAGVTEAAGEIKHGYDEAKAEAEE
jgi:hypothetical protein